MQMTEVTALNIYDRRQTTNDKLLLAMIICKWNIKDENM